MKLQDMSVKTMKAMAAPTGTLVAITGESDLPFSLRRLFYVTGVPRGVTRGSHAHKECQQAYICLNGAIEVLCDDGNAKRNFSLRRPSDVLHVPGGIWSELTYAEDNSILAVLCDQPYDENDYIRDYDSFLSYSRQTKR